MVPHFLFRGGGLFERYFPFLQEIAPCRRKGESSFSFY